jgi:hypothetical protein
MGRAMRGPKRGAPVGHVRRGARVRRIGLVDRATHDPRAHVDREPVDAGVEVEVEDGLAHRHAGRRAPGAGGDLGGGSAFLNVDDTPLVDLVEAGSASGRLGGPGSRCPGGRGLSGRGPSGRGLGWARAPARGGRAASEQGESEREAEERVRRARAQRGTEVQSSLTFVGLAAPGKTGRIRAAELCSRRPWLVQTAPCASFLGSPWSSSPPAPA